MSSVNIDCDGCKNMYFWHRGVPRVVLRSWAPTHSLAAIAVPQSWADAEILLWLFFGARPRALVLMSTPFPPLPQYSQALPEGGVAGAVEGLALVGRRLPPLECLGLLWSAEESGHAYL